MQRFTKDVSEISLENTLSKLFSSKMKLEEDNSPFMKYSLSLRFPNFSNKNKEKSETETKLNSLSLNFPSFDREELHTILKESSLDIEKAKERIRDNIIRKKRQKFKNFSGVKKGGFGVSSDVKAVISNKLGKRIYNDYKEAYKNLFSFNEGKNNSAFECSYNENSNNSNNSCITLRNSNVFNINSTSSNLTSDNFTTSNASSHDVFSHCQNHLKSFSEIKADILGINKKESLILYLSSLLRQISEVKKRRKTAEILLKIKGKISEENENYSNSIKILCRRLGKDRAEEEKMTEKIGENERVIETLMGKIRMQSQIGDKLYEIINKEDNN